MIYYSPESGHYGLKRFRMSACAGEFDAGNPRGYRGAAPLKQIAKSHTIIMTKNK